MRMQLAMLLVINTLCLKKCTSVVTFDVSTTYCLRDIYVYS